MGLDYHAVDSLLQASGRGASFDHTLIVGRQRLNLHPAEVKALAALPATRAQPSRQQLLRDYRFGDYCDDFLSEFLGVQLLTVLDNSPYEGATLLHDLNKPVQEKYWERFDAIIDGGSLEHVFDFPTAAANLMRMTKVGGRLLISVPANNLCGHGFYQFSPELMFRVFSADNGFTLNRVVLLEATWPAVQLAPKRDAYVVTDPAHVHGRVALVSKRPVMMMVEATRTADTEPFAVPPQQSDYVEMWDHHTQRGTRAQARLAKRLVRRLPARLSAAIVGRYQRRRRSFANTRFYEKL